MGDQFVVSLSFSERYQKRAKSYTYKIGKKGSKPRTRKLTKNCWEECWGCLIFVYVFLCYPRTLHVPTLLSYSIFSRSFSLLFQLARVSFVWLWNNNKFISFFCSNFTPEKIYTSSLLHYQLTCQTSPFTILSHFSISKHELHTIKFLSLPKKRSHGAISDTLRKKKKFAKRVNKKVGREWTFFYQM